MRHLRDVAKVVEAIRAADADESARRRKESRGLHFNSDYPHKDERWARDTTLRRGDGPDPA